MAKEQFLKAFLGNTPEEAEKVYRDFSDLLNLMSYSFHNITGLEKSDLFAEALVGLARATRDFDPNRGHDFRTFAIYKIKDALYDYIRKFSSVVVIPSYIAKAKSLKGRLRQCLASNDVPWFIIEEILELGLDSQHDLYYSSCKSLLEKLHALAERASIDYCELMLRIEYSTTITVDEEVDSEVDDAKAELAELIDSLSEEEKVVVLGVYAGKSYREIGEEAGKSHTWAANVFKKVQAKHKGRR